MPQVRENPLFDASPHLGVMAGTCVMIEDGEVCFAGPLGSSPDSANKLVLLNPVDFEKLKAHVEKHRH